MTSFCQRAINRRLLMANISAFGLCSLVPVATGQAPTPPQDEPIRAIAIKPWTGEWVAASIGAGVIGWIGGLAFSSLLSSIFPEERRQPLTLSELQQVIDRAVAQIVATIQTGWRGSIGSHLYAAFQNLERFAVAADRQERRHLARQALHASDEALGFADGIGSSYLRPYVLASQAQMAAIVACYKTSADRRLWVINFCRSRRDHQRRIGSFTDTERAKITDIIIGYREPKITVKKDDTCGYHFLQPDSAGHAPYSTNCTRATNFADARAEMCRQLRLALNNWGNAVAKTGPLHDMFVDMQIYTIPHITTMLRRWERAERLLLQQNRLSLRQLGLRRLSADGWIGDIPNGQPERWLVCPSRDPIKVIDNVTGTETTYPR